MASKAPVGDAQTDRVQQVLDAQAARKRQRLDAVSKKKALSLRVDEDVIDQFKSQGEDWEARMNIALRKAVGLRVP